VQRDLDVAVLARVGRRLARAGRGHVLGEGERDEGPGLAYVGDGRARRAPGSGPGDLWWELVLVGGGLEGVTGRLLST